MIQLGTVPFINAKPIIYPLEKGLISNDFEISYYAPSVLSRRLADRDVDIGLIPVAELLKRNSYRVIPDISISSEGRVDSVALVLDKKLSEVKKVAVDERSQSSTALLRVILELFNDLSPEYVKRKYDKDFFSGVDAGMVIGDSGLHLIYEKMDDDNLLDLGELWTQYTGLPFVYAVYALNSEVHLGENLNSLLLSKEKGKEYIPEIAESLSGKIDVSTEFCINYLSNRIKYDLGRREIEAITRYSEYLSELGYCDKVQELNFYSN